MDIDSSREQSAPPVRLLDFATFPFPTVLSSRLWGRLHDSGAVQVEAWFVLLLYRGLHMKQTFMVDPTDVSGSLDVMLEECIIGQ